MSELSEHQLYVLGRMKFGNDYRTNELGVRLSVNRDFMLNLEKLGLVHRKTKGVFGTMEGDPNFEVWYKKRKI